MLDGLQSRAHLLSNAALVGALSALGPKATGLLPMPSRDVPSASSSTAHQQEQGQQHRQQQQPLLPQQQVQQQRVMGHSSSGPLVSGDGLTNTTLATFPAALPPAEHPAWLAALLAEVSRPHRLAAMSGKQLVRILVVLTQVNSSSSVCARGFCN